MNHRFFFSKNKKVKRLKKGGIFSEEQLVSERMSRKEQREESHKLGVKGRRRKKKEDSMNMDVSQIKKEKERRMRRKVRKRRERGGNLIKSRGSSPLSSLSCEQLSGCKSGKRRRKI